MALTGALASHPVLKAACLAGNATGPADLGGCAMVALIDHLADVSSSQLALDLGLGPSFTNNAAALAQLAAAVRAAIPDSLTNAARAQRNANDPDAGMSVYDACLSTAAARLEWQRLSSGCGLACGVPLAAPGQPRPVGLRYALGGERGMVSATAYLQRYSAHLQCGGLGAPGARAPLRDVDMNIPTNTLLDPGRIKARRKVSRGTEFVRGPALSTVFLFRTDDLMQVTTYNSNQAPWLSIVTQTLGMTGNLLFALLLIKMLSDAWCKRALRRHPAGARLYTSCAQLICCVRDRKQEGGKEGDSEGRDSRSSEIFGGAHPGTPSSRSGRASPTPSRPSRDGAVYRPGETPGISPGSPARGHARVVALIGNPMHVAGPASSSSTRPLGGPRAETL